MCYAFQDEYDFDKQTIKMHLFLDDQDRGVYFASIVAPMSYKEANTFFSTNLISGIVNFIVAPGIRRKSLGIAGGGVSKWQMTNMILKENPLVIFTNGSGITYTFTTDELLGELWPTNVYTERWDLNSENKPGRQSARNVIGHIIPNVNTDNVNIKSNSLGDFCNGIPAINDPRDGQSYPTVQIGTQCWLKTNMNYHSGNSFCYDNNGSNCYIYGRLYDWETALHVCPQGWHLPNDAEWNKLVEYLGGLTMAGGKMKDVGTAYWYSPNTGANNSSGFSALPGGSSDQGFASLSKNGYFWSSTQNADSNPGYWMFFNMKENILHDYYDKKVGFSVRCLKD
jgi:uncharacterized protein (TIGR02145 family)